MKIIIATANSNKIREIQNKFKDIDEIEFSSLKDLPEIPEIIENGLTFEENSLIKARTVCSLTGMAAMADDSGLAVDALNGEPGIYSARYAGENATDEDRNRKLLENLKGIPDEKRTARFVCAISIVLPDGREFVTEGKCEGIIISGPRGEGGFGYDPIFYLPDLKKSMAEMSMDEKNKTSHRSAALEKAHEILKGIMNKTI